MKKLFCAFILTLALSVSAFANPFLLTRHYSGAEIKDGAANYDNAKFLHFELQVASYDITATQAHVDATGTLTLSGGKYTYNNGESKIDGTNHDFNLKAEMDVGNDGIAYEIGERLTGAANTGLNGVEAAWKFDSLSDLNGSATIPTFKSTKSQTEVPYIKYNYDGDGKIASIYWSIVNPSDTNTALSLSYPSQIRIRLRDKNKNWIETENFKGKKRLFSNEFDANSTPSGTITLDTALDPDTLEYFEIHLYNRTSSESAMLRYVWRFFTYAEDLGEPYEDDPDYENNEETETPHLWSLHYSRADLVDGEANYGNAEFERVKITLTTDDTEATQEQVDATGTLTLSGGKYTYSGEKVDGTSKTFDLTADMEIGSNLDYRTASDFLGDADTGLNGVTATWTFESDAVKNGSGVIPEFSSTKTQLQNVVPYLKLTYDDSDKISAVDWAIVKSSDVKTPMSVNYDSRLRIKVVYKNDDSKTLMSKTDFTAGTAISGEIDLEEETIDPSTVQFFEVSFRNRADTDNPIAHEWRFYPAGSNSTNGSGGGCNAAGFAGVVALLGALFLKKR